MRASFRCLGSVSASVRALFFIKEKSRWNRRWKNRSMSNQLSVPFAETPLLAGSFSLFWIILPHPGRKAEVEIGFARIFCPQVAGQLNSFAVYPSPDPCLIRCGTQPADRIPRIGRLLKQ